MVLVITLLALVLLAGLVFYVLNLGRQVNARVVTQNSADATAAAAGGWVARSLNTVANNNTGMAQLISSVAVLDSMPQGVGYAYDDLSALKTVLDQQLGRGVRDAWLRDGLGDLRSEIEEQVNILDPLNDLLDDGSYDIRNMTFYNGPAGRGSIWKAIEAMDLYSQAAMENLGVLAQLNAMRGGEADLDADGGNVGGGNAALVLPVLPGVPWTRGTFDDFKRPVKMGLLPEATDDDIINRGPWDTVFGWRELLGGQEKGYYEDGNLSLAEGGHGKVPLGRSAGADPDRQFIVTGHEPAVAYTTYGPYKWTMDRMGAFNNAHLFHSRFATYINKMADVKIGYVWPGETTYPPDRPLPMVAIGYRNAGDYSAGDSAWEIPIVKDYRYWFDGPNLQRSSPASNYFYLEDGVNTTSNDLVLRVVDQGDGQSEVTYISQATQNWIYDIVGPDGTVVLKGLGRGINGRRTGSYSTQIPTPPNVIIEPEWVTSYPQARDLGEQDAQTSDKRIIETCYIVSEIKSRYPSNDPRFGTPGTYAKDMGHGSHNPRIVYVKGWVDPELWGVPQIENYIWRDEWEYTVYFDASVGLPQQLDTFGDPAPQVVYRVDDYVFAGVNIGRQVEIRNPYNFAGQTKLPAPIDLNHDLVTTAQTSRRQFLTYLAVARRNDRALLWPAKFDGRKPYPNMVALAQIQVFNNHSFDLWTQMWTAQLEPVGDYDGWMQTLDAGQGDAGRIPALDASELVNLAQYLKNAQSISDAALKH